MELKYQGAWGLLLRLWTFNRTAYGIEIKKNKSCFSE